MGSPPPITEEAIARQSPEVRANIRTLLARIAEQDRRIAELEARLKQSPRNSALPPSSEHPHAKHQRPLIPTEQCAVVVAAHFAHETGGLRSTPG